MVCDARRRSVGRQAVCRRSSALPALAAPLLRHPPGCCPGARLPSCRRARARPAPSLGCARLWARCVARMVTRVGGCGARGRPPEPGAASWRCLRRPLPSAGPRPRPVRVWSPRGPCLCRCRCLRSRCAGGPLRAPRAACVPGGYVRSAPLPVSAVAAVPSLAQSARGGLLPLAPHPGAASSAGAARPSGGLAAGGCALRCARPARLVGQVRALLCARWLMMGARCCTSPRRSRGPDPHRCPQGRAHRQTPPGGRALSGSACRIRPPRPGRAGVAAKRWQNGGKTLALTHPPGRILQRAHTRARARVGRQNPAQSSAAAARSMRAGRKKTQDRTAILHQSEGMLPMISRR